MAKSKKSTNDWAVIEYTDGVCGVCHTSEVNENDERVKIISEHNDVNEAAKKAEAHSKKKKLNFKF
jgi:hypothetical protein